MNSEDNGLESQRNICDVEVNGSVNGAKVCQDVSGIAQRSYTSPGTLLGCLPNVTEFSLCRVNSNMNSFKICQAACDKVELCGVQK